MSLTYLRHEIAIARVNLKNHSHRDVTHMSMEEFESTLSKYSKSSSKEHKCENLWICGSSKASMVIQTKNGVGMSWMKPTFLSHSQKRNLN